MARKPARLVLPALLFLAALGASTATRANGAFPDEFSVHFPLPAPHRILIGANFGLLVSEDDGATWRYACEPWVTEGSDAALSQANVNFYQVQADGAVLAQSVHITRTTDDACTWPQSTGPVLSLATAAVADIFPDPNDATFVIAVVDVANGSELVTSTDSGKTFGEPIYTTTDLLTGIEISQTLPSVIYATTVPISGQGGTLLRSTDRGMTWTSAATPSAQFTEPLIIGIDPLDSDTVYLRIPGAGTDSLVIYDNKTQTFDNALAVNTYFSAFLRSGDGTLYAGAYGSLYFRAPGAASFTEIPGPNFRCLGQRPGTTRIYACGDFTIDNFSLGYSDDDGQHFSKVMSFTDLLGPLTCPPVATNCTDHWARIQGVLGISDAGVSEPDGGVVGDAGSTGTNDAGTIPDAGTVSPPPTGGSGKSGCSTAAAGGSAMFILMALLLRRRKS